MVGPVRIKQNHSSSCFACGEGSPDSWCGRLVLGARSELDQTKVLLNFQPGQLVFREGDPCNGIYIIRYGTVAQLSAGPSEEDSVVGICHQEDTLGYRAFVTDSPHRYSAEATTECQVCYIDRSTLKSVIDADPAVGHRFLCEMAVKKEEIEALIVKSRTLPVRARLAQVLLVFKDRYAKADEEGRMRFELPISRGILASVVGTRPESLSRAIRALEQDGVAEFQGRSVLVDDLDDLLDEIEGRSSRT